MSKKKHRQKGREQEETVFQLDGENRGRFDSSAFSSSSAGDPPATSGAKKKRNVGSEPGRKEAVGLRIIGGTFRGSKLQYIGDNRVRPMKDRVREAVFNLIGPGIKGLHVVDLFGGTGAMTIEAISRGAVSATVIELHLPTAALLRRNLESLDLLETCTLRKTDAFFWAKYREEHPSGPPWIVFCCPPYHFYIDRWEEMREMLENLLDSAPTGSLFVIESDERFDFELLPIVPDPNKIRSYPPAKVGIFIKRAE